MKFFTKITSWEITKRQKFILMSFFLTVVLVAAQTVPDSLRFATIVALALATTFLAIFALWGELSGVKYLLLLMLPVYFVVGASLFYFLLPVRWLTRLPFALVFGISTYLLMLTANIYNVAAIRTIALHRAARAVGMLFTLVAAFFLINVLFSLHLAFYFNFSGVVLISAPLYLVQLWSYGLEDYISRKVALYTLVFTLVTGQMATVFSFWPFEPINGALILVTVMYALLGVGQFAVVDGLKRKIVYEYVGVAVIVVLIVLITTRWGG